MKQNTRIAGILLAAGDSVRMGYPKALLTYNGVSFIDTILNNLQISGYQPIISILGEAGDTICECTSVDNYECWYNPNPQDGMLSSLKIAIKKLPDDCDGFVLALVDHPAVQLSTYQMILESAIKNPDRIIIPRFFGKKGHPVYFARRYFQQLLDTPNDQGAKIVVHRHQNDIYYLPVEDSAVLKDIDTPEEYEVLPH